MEQSIIARSKPGVGANVARICIPAVLGLMFFVQPAWSVISISPSPSYNGNYTVSWWSPLGCATYYDDFGFSWEICYVLTEQQGDQYGPVTGSWTSGSSMNVSGKPSGTYTYTVTAYYYSYFWGNSVYQAEAPTSVQVILPLPDPNSNYQHWSGPANDIQSFRFFWNAQHATSCNADVRWWRAGGVPAGTWGPQNVALNSQIFVWKNAADMDFAMARVTCYGPGGENYEEWRLEFNQFGSW